jgi:hypothetical protein
MPSGREARLLTATLDNKSLATRLTTGMRIHLCRHLSSILLGMPEHRARQPNHSDGGGHRALSCIELYRLHRDFLPPLGLQECLSSEKDELSSRGDSGHIRASAV